MLKLEVIKFFKERDYEIYFIDSCFSICTFNNNNNILISYFILYCIFISNTFTNSLSLSLIFFFYFIDLLFCIK